MLNYKFSGIIHFIMMFYHVSLRILITSLMITFGTLVQFKDIFGCGAFSPTWTYVCCSTLEKLDEDIWRPKPDLWFFPPLDGSAPAKDVDPSTPFPVMLPWPGYEDASTEIKPGKHNITM